MVRIHLLHLIFQNRSPTWGFFVGVQTYKNSFIYIMSSKNNRSQRRQSIRENESNEYENKLKTHQKEFNSQIQRIQPKTKNQARLIESIRDNHVTIAAAKSGCGKTLIALYEAVCMMEKGLIDQILYTKPIVEFREQRSLGFMPGDENEKTLPLLAPVFDNLEVFMSSGKSNYLIEKGKIKYQPLEFIRGRSLRNTVIIFDESQNASIHCALSIISRIEESSKVIMLGDPQQRDILLPQNALSDALVRLRGAESVGVVEFTPKDIIRSAFLKEVLTRYDD
jgi:phosphate starvation-inducible PhoH-like protein